MSFSEWALPRLSKLLPLDDESLEQIISYSESLPKDAAANHLKNLLGDSPQALEFITSFNSRRQMSTPTPGPSASHAADGPIAPVPKAKPKKKKGNAGFNRLPTPRQVQNQGDVSGAYIKKDLDDYVPAKPKAREEQHRNTFGLASTPQQSGIPSPVPSRPSSTEPRVSSTQAPNKAASSGEGRQIGDFKPKSKSSAAKPNSAKVSITGGTPMKGASTALTDLDYAIRALEIQTNPSLTPTTEEDAKRRCSCMGTRHELLSAAPNCLNCGKIICVKEGLGPCTFCKTPLLSRSEISAMVRILKDERGKEKMDANNAVHKRAEISRSPRPFSGSHQSSPGGSAPASDTEPDKLSAAMAHRDKLLAYQAQNAKRTKIRDEAADFETPVGGQNMWASPAERALQLKRQQKALREQEWNARPEWEKRRVVASIDLVGGKVVKRMATTERPATPESEVDEKTVVEQPAKDDEGGAFRHNPLLGGLIRPVAKVDGKGKQKAVSHENKTTWRRVQDDNNDNEQWILDGGLRGSAQIDTLATEEPPCG